MLQYVLNISIPDSRKSSEIGYFCEESRWKRVPIEQATILTWEKALKYRRLLRKMGYHVVVEEH